MNKYNGARHLDLLFISWGHRFCILFKDRWVLLFQLQWRNARVHGKMCKDLSIWFEDAMMYDTLLIW